MKVNKPFLFIDMDSCMRSNRFLRNIDARISISKIHFNKKGDQALLYYHFQKRNLGTGRVIFASKADNQWRIEKEIIVWES